MIALRDGLCRGCHQAIEQGRPIFFDKNEGAYHWDCWESIPQPSWLIQQAERMGFQKWPPEMFNEHEQQWSF